MLSLSKQVPAPVAPTSPTLGNSGDSYRMAYILWPFSRTGGHDDRTWQAVAGSRPCRP